MKKTIATPVRLQRPAKELTKAEKDELKNYGDKDLTAEEIAAREAEEAAALAAKPMNDWKAEIQETDGDINARVIEEIYEALEAPVKAKLSKETKDRFARRAEIRSRKPTE